MSRRLLVLGWHNIDPTPAFPDPPEVGRRGFAHQLRMLSRFANVLPLSHALDLMEAGDPLPPRSVVLTFDDGYRDNLDVGVPMLARHGLPATFFLVPGFLSGTVGAWWEDLSSAFERATVPYLDWDDTRYDLSTGTSRLAAVDEVREGLKRFDHATRVEAVAEIGERLEPAHEPDRPLFMGWDGAQALAAAGHEIGSHTVSHAILAREGLEEQAAELVDSRVELEKRLGRTVDTFAFPNGAEGDYTDRTCSAVTDTGYRCAITTRRGFASENDSRYEMRRVVINPTTDLRSVAAGGWRRVRSVVRRGG